jgi:glutamyl-tRNA reductase
MRILVIGCNHRTLPVEQRERLALDSSHCADVLRTFRKTFPECEAVLLSTCNRTELYMARAVHGHPRVEEAVDFLALCCSAFPHEFSESLYEHTDEDAIRHLFRVTSSLDSMVIGESQIVAQVKHALALAEQYQAIGRGLRPLFQRALAVAKEIHSSTGIAAGQVSVASTAVSWLRQELGSFDKKSVLLIGAGQHGTATLQHVLTAGPRQVWLTSRHVNRAQDVARRITPTDRTAVTVVPFEDRQRYVYDADIIISAASGDEPLLTPQHLQNGGPRSKVLLDTAVPRSIDPNVATMPGIRLLNIDDLRGPAEAAMQDRSRHIDQCIAIIGQHVQEYLAWQRSRDIGPILEALDDRIDAISVRELERVLPKLRHIDPADRALLEQMLHRIARKLLHDPAKTLHEKAADGRARTYAEALRTLFHLTTEE